jgi:hypothetical protein
MLWVDPDSLPKPDHRQLSSLDQSAKVPDAELTFFGCLLYRQEAGVGTSVVLRPRPRWPPLSL